MKYEIVPMNPDHLETLLGENPALSSYPELQKAYFSPGSCSYCLLADQVPVLAGGIVNLQWKRGEAWVLPGSLFRSHLKQGIKGMREYIPILSKQFHFSRIQATCVEGLPKTIVKHLGFSYEGTMKKYGPRGETCDVYALIFEEGE